MLLDNNCWLWTGDKCTNWKYHTWPIQPVYNLFSLSSSINNYVTPWLIASRDDLTWSQKLLIWIHSHMVDSLDGVLSCLEDEPWFRLSSAALMKDVCQDCHGTLNLPCVHSKMTTTKRVNAYLMYYRPQPKIININIKVIYLNFYLIWWHTGGSLYSCVFTNAVSISKKNIHE